MRLAAATVSAQPHTTADPDQHQLPSAHPVKWRDPEVHDPVTPGGQMFWERGPDGRMRPKALYDSVVLKAVGRMREWACMDGKCPKQDDDWSEDLRMLIHMEYLWRRSFRQKHVETIRYDARRMLARQRALECTMESEEA
ncbi:hypothetical protein HaLaN_27066, partial [Haematococcus lacustris]